jgi:hypothetical protein
MERLNSAICLLAVYGQLVCFLIVATRLYLRRADLRGPAWRLFTLPFLLALAVRAAAPFGPIVNSGRDLAYLDQILLAPSAAHTHLPSAMFQFCRLFPDPVPVLEWAQIAAGSACAGLVALLAYAFYRREATAMIAGLLGAVFVAAARVDASPDAVTSLRLVTMLTALAVRLYHRSPSTTGLLSAGLGAIAMSYGRLESPLFAALLLIWLAADEPRQPGPAHTVLRGGTWAAGGAILCAAATGMLLDRWLLVPLMALAGVWLIRRRGRWPASRRVLLLTTAVAIALLPRFFEVTELERETYSRFPESLMFLFGRTNLFFNLSLCTPFAPILLALGIATCRPHAPTAAGYLLSVALPAWAFGLLFMGNASAIMRLQGNGVFLLLPLAGLGAGRLIDGLSARWERSRLWAPALAAVVIASSLLLGGNALTESTSLDQEYAFMRRLPERLPSGSTIHQLPRQEAASVVSIPTVLAQRAGIELRGLNSSLPLPAGSLVFLPAGCRRYRNGEILPGIGMTLGQMVWDGRVDKRWYRHFLLALDRDRYLETAFDRLAVFERPQCWNLRQRLALQPYQIERIRRSSLEGHLMPPEFEFGLYRVTAEH